MSVPPAQRKVPQLNSSGNGSDGNEQRQGITICTREWKGSNTTGRPVVLNLSWFVAPFQRLSTFVAPCAHQ